MAERRSNKPRFGQSERHQAWPEGFTFLHTSYLITDEERAEIAAALGVPKDSPHVAATVEAIRRYDARENAMAALPAGDHRERDKKTLETLARAMDGVNANVLRRLARYGVDCQNWDPQHIADAARESAKAIVQEIPARRRRPPKVSRSATIKQLSDIYTRATGKRATLNVTSGSAVTAAGKPSGPFFRFMRVAVAPAPSLVCLSDHALAAAVKRATRTK